MTSHERLLREINSAAYPITKVIMALCPKATMSPVPGSDRRWTMPCPFRNDNDNDNHNGKVGGGAGEPTCIIDLDRNVAYVPELGLGGSTVQFVMDLLGISERMAAQKALDIINAPEKGQSEGALALDPMECTKDDDEDEQSEEPLRREKVRGVLRWMHRILQRALWESKDNAGREFCKSRHWSEETLKLAQIGYAAEGRILEEAMADEDSDSVLHTLVEMGILYEHNYRGDVTYTGAHDNRVAYPIYNAYGELTAFSFRDDGTNEAKWNEEHEKRLQQFKDKGDIASYNSESGQKYGKKCLYMRSEASLEPSRQQLFGMEAASKAMTRTHDRKMYIVEGQPDQMRIRSLGIENVVAVMTATISEDYIDTRTGYVEDDTRGKFGILKKEGCLSLCLIPDIDKYDPDKGQRYGVGITQTIKNVENAIKAGFKVTVKEIEPHQIEKTVGDKVVVTEPWEQKEDADSYFDRHPDMWAKVEEKPWHKWLAAKWRLDMDGADPESRVIYTKRMAECIAMFKEKATRQEIITDVLKENKLFQKSLLTNAVLEILGQKAALQQRKEQKSQGDLARFGFVEANGCYRRVSADEPFTDFIINPKYFIKKVGGGSFWICEILCYDGNMEVINPTDEDVTSLAKFKKLAASAAMSFEGKDPELVRIFKYIKSVAEEVKKIGRYGWQSAQKAYAWGNGAMINGEWFPANKYGVVDLPGDTHLFIPSAQTYDAVNEDDDEEKFQFAHSFSYTPVKSNNAFGTGSAKTYTIKEVFKQMHDVIGEAGDFGAMFLVASIFFDVVRKQGRGFPIFTCYGPKGSGKSTIGEVLTHFFGTKHMMQNLESATPAALDALVTSGSNCVVHWDEYSEGVGRDSKKLDQIKNLWGGDGRSKMSASTNYQEASSKKVRCGVVLTGEVMPNHIDSMPRRMVMFNFFDDKEKFAANEAAYNLLVEMYTPGLQYLTAEILAQRTLFEQQFPTVYQNMLKIVNEKLKGQQGIESSIKTNWTQLLASYFTLSEMDWWPFDFIEIVDKTVEKIVWQSAVSESKNRRAVFWKQLLLAAESDQLWMGVHIKIKYTHQLSNNEPMKKDWARRATRVLLLRFDNVFQIIERAATGNQALRDQLMSAGSMRDYINKECYLGETRQETFFDADQRGYALPDRNGSYHANRKSGVMVFDYERLKKRYDIDFDNVPECRFAGPVPTDVEEYNNNSAQPIPEGVDPDDPLGAKQGNLFG